MYNVNNNENKSTSICFQPTSSTINKPSNELGPKIVSVTQNAENILTENRNHNLYGIGAATLAGSLAGAAAVVALHPFGMITGALANAACGLCMALPVASSTAYVTTTVMDSINPDEEVTQARKVITKGPKGQD